MTNQSEQLEAELKRIKRVSDMMVTMHAELRDKYRKRSDRLEYGLLAGSVILVALVWVDPALFQRIHLSITDSRFVVGAVAILTFFLSVWSTRVNWKGKSEGHAHATKAYSQAKLRCSSILATLDKCTESEIMAFMERYTALGDVCVPIPESQFLELKQKHLSKVRASRNLDATFEVDVETAEENDEVEEEEH